MTGPRLAWLLLLLVMLLPPRPVEAQRGDVLTTPDSTRFVASSRGRVYYPVTCDAWRGLAPGNLIFFRSAEAARTRGYSPTRNRACAAPTSLADLAPLATVARGGPASPGEASPAASAGAGSAATPESTAAPHGRLVGICVIERVVDGDTVHCRGGVRIRLLLIDAPEMAQSDFGLRARLALEELLPRGDSATVEVDVQEQDRYGRVLAHLHASDGTWANRALVRRGYALVLVYPPNVRHVEALRAAADSARAEGRGLWERGAFECAPVDFRAGRCGG